MRLIDKLLCSEEPLSSVPLRVAEADKQSQDHRLVQQLKIENLPPVIMEVYSEEPLLEQ